MHEPTISFSIHEDKEKEMKKILTAVYDALRQKGYNPITIPKHEPIKKVYVEMVKKVIEKENFENEELQ